MSHLPKEQHEQARSTLRAAWKLDADEGIRKLEQYASWLEREWPSAAASLREGLPELFTVNRLGLPKALRRCLTTTNIIDSSHPGVRRHTRRVSRWQNEAMAVRSGAVGSGDVFLLLPTFNYRRDTLAPPSNPPIPLNPPTPVSGEPPFVAPILPRVLRPSPTHFPPRRYQARIPLRFPRTPRPRQYRSWSSSLPRPLGLGVWPAR